MTNSSDTIGNRTRDLPACSAVPQPTAPPRAQSNKLYIPFNIHILPQTVRSAYKDKSINCLYLFIMIHTKPTNVVTAGSAYMYRWASKF